MSAETTRVLSAHDRFYVVVRRRPLTQVAAELGLNIRTLLSWLDGKSGLRSTEAIILAWIAAQEAQQAAAGEAAQC